MQLALERLARHLHRFLKILPAAVLFLVDVTKKLAHVTTDSYTEEAARLRRGDAEEKTCREGDVGQPEDPKDAIPRP